MDQDVRNRCEIAYSFKHPDKLEERDPEDFGRGKPKAKRLNGDRIWLLERFLWGRGGLARG